MPRLNIHLKNRVPSTSVWIAILLLGSVLGCRRNTPFPNEQERGNNYILIAAAMRMGNSGMALQLLSDSIETSWDGVSVVGIDGVATNWQRIINGAHVDQLSRTILNTRAIDPQRMRDSGTIVFRLRDSTSKIGFHDSTMTFVSEWRLDKRLRDWRLQHDSIRSGR